MIIIVSAGTPPTKELLLRYTPQASRVIAADAGAAACLRAGVRPDVVVGDMDSLAPEDQERIAAQGVEVRRYPRHKDWTDTSLALDMALAENPDEVVLLGATGGRFDHTLANVHLLVKALHAGVRARVVDDEQEIFVLEGEYALRGRAGCTVSLLPLTARVDGVCLRGFRWPLDDAVMDMGDPYGVSNVVENDEALIVCGRGMLAGIVSFSV